MLGKTVKFGKIASFSFRIKIIEGKPINIKKMSRKSVEMMKKTRDTIRIEAVIKKNS